MSLNNTRLSQQIVLKMAAGALFSVLILVDLHFPEGLTEKDWLCSPKGEQKFTKTMLRSTSLLDHGCFQLIFALPLGCRANPFQSSPQGSEGLPGLGLKTKLQLPFSTQFAHSTWYCLCSLIGCYKQQATS